MKKLFITLSLLLLSFFCFSQNQGEIFSDDNGNRFRLLQAWTLPVDFNGNYVHGEAQNVLNTTSFYWQLIRTENPDNFGNYTYFMYFYANSAKGNYNNFILTDVVIRELVVEESFQGQRRTVFQTSVYLIDRSGNKIIRWISDWKNAHVTFSYGNSFQKIHYDKQNKRFKDNGR